MEGNPAARCWVIPVKTNSAAFEKANLDRLELKCVDVTDGSLKELST
jgi:hypothetical protein